MNPITLQARDRTITFPRRPLVMGIVNINDDSFSGDGTLDIDQSLQTARTMVSAGADIIDIGAESARTNRGPISPAEEAARLVPFIQRFPTEVATSQPADDTQLHPPLLSLNTWRPEVVANVLPHGGDLLNDISALPDDTNARLCADHTTALLIMHSVGEPKVPHTSESYPDIVATLDRFFEQKIKLAEAAGLSERQVILDPGLDFAKQRDDNLRIIKHLERLQRFHRPVLLPVSRKTVIGDVLDLPDPRDRDAGTIALVAAGLSRGAHIFRVHNVKAAHSTIKTLHALS